MADDHPDAAAVREQIVEAHRTAHTVRGRASAAALATLINNPVKTAVELAIRVVTSSPTSDGGDA